MKKIKCMAVFAMLVVMAVFSAYSQNANGAELLQKGKNYEAKKEYVYALGCYYDAIVASDETDAEAKNAFDTLAGYIRQGNPGPGKYNEFTLHDGWVALLQNAEKYWTENCPWQFIFKIENKTVDYATRTASYDLVIGSYLEISSNKTAKSKISKYSVIVDETIFSGLDKAWREDWTDIKWEKNWRGNYSGESYWPHRSVYSNAQGKYLQSGSALFEYDGEIYCAWEFEGAYSQYYRQLSTTLYDMKVAICDLSGKELLKSERVLYKDIETKYTFTGVSPDIMDLIDNKQITIKISDLYLEYGKYNKNDDKGGRSFIKNFPELKLTVSPENVNIPDLLSHDESGTIPYVFMQSNDSIRYFLNKSKITKIKIPYGIKSIEGLFSGCSSLMSVVIPDSVTSIAGYTFSNCESLTSITIPDSVTTIEYRAFENCSSLTNITIPNSVTSIGNNAFNGCISLTNVTIPNSVTTIGERTFSYCKSLTSVNIPDSVTSIGKESFRDCSSLTSVTIPDGVTTIGDFVFSNCSSLTSVTIPDSVTSIKYRAFYDCALLTSVTIPDSVTSIHQESFNREVMVTYKGTTDTWKNIYNKFF